MVMINVTDRGGTLHEIEAEAGQPLMWALSDNNLDIEAVCAGQMSCLTCHIHVEKGWLDKTGHCEGDEAEVLEDLLHYRAESRLSCQLVVSDALNGLACQIAPAEG